MRKYATYKPSGVDWLGDIPSGWNISRIKFLARVNPQKGQSEFLKTSDELCVFLPMENVNEDGSFSNDTKKKISEVWDGFTYFERNDVVIAKITPCFENGKGAYLSNLETQIGFGTTEFHVLRANVSKILPKLLFYLIRSDVFMTTGKAFMRGSAGQQRVPTEFVLDFFVPFANISEQQSIVCFLDYKTGQIDRFIANRQDQIELLKEQKASIINKAVTNGINPDAKMKPSGIEWLKEIPEHWLACKVRRLLNILTDFTANGSFADLAKNVKYLDVPDYSRLIRLTDLRDNLKNDGIFVSKEAHEYLSKSELYGDEILMANVGAYAGLVCLVPKIDFKATLGPNMLLLKFDEKRMSNQYAFILLGSDCYYKLLMNKALSSAQPKLNKEDVKSIDFILPPTLEEQQAILDFIKKEISSIDTLIAKYQNQIDLMQEYRTALISQVVTGKIDVRDWQPKERGRAV